MKHVYDAGSVLPLRLSVLRAAVHWSPLRGSRRGPADVHTSVLLLDARGRLASDRDAVGPEQAGDDTGGVRRLPKRRHREGLMDALEIRPGALPPAVRRVVLAVSADGAPFGTAGSLQLTLWDVENDLPVTARPILAEREDHTTLVCGELWRGLSGWEFRDVRRGLAGGPADLVAAHRAAPEAAGPPPLNFGPDGAPRRARRPAAPVPPPLPAGPPVTPPPPQRAPYVAPDPAPAPAPDAHAADPRAAAPAPGGAPGAGLPPVPSPPAPAPSPGAAQPPGPAGASVAPPGRNATPRVHLPPQGPQFRSVDRDG
ncbi:TerD family protein [Streptomyces bohaiensis]|uniref:TerD family protein n=1 Tax=Streptomyces bohaiensis TaxID=1431344 RepID=UPI003B819FEC